MHKQITAWLQQQSNGYSRIAAGDRLGCGRGIFNCVFDKGLTPTLKTLNTIAQTRNIPLWELIKEIEETPIAQ